MEIWSIQNIAFKISRLTRQKAGFFTGFPPNLVVIVVLNVFFDLRRCEKRLCLSKSDVWLARTTVFELWRKKCRDATRSRSGCRCQMFSCKHAKIIKISVFVVYWKWHSNWKASEWILSMFVVGCCILDGNFLSHGDVERSIWMRRCGLGVIKWLILTPSYTLKAIKLLGQVRASVTAFFGLIVGILTRNFVTRFGAKR